VPLTRTTPTRTEIQYDFSNHGWLSFTKEINPYCPPPAPTPKKKQTGGNRKKKKGKKSHNPKFSNILKLLLKMKCEIVPESFCFVAGVWQSL